MKKVIFLLGVIVISLGAFAQDSTMNEQDTSLSTMGYTKKNCLVMKDGKMMMMKRGDTTLMMAMDKSVTLKNGAIVMTDGNVKMLDGTTKMLKEGQYIDKDGKMGWMKKYRM